MGDRLGSPRAHVGQSGQYHAALGRAVTIGIRADDDSIFGGGECEDLVRVTPLTMGRSVSTTDF